MAAVADGVVHPGVPGPLKAPPGWRDRVESVCRSWYGTPFRDKGMVKGPSGGVDCCTFVIGVAAELGLFPSFVPEYYSQQWPINERGERYLNTVRQFCDLVPNGAERFPGDLLFFRLPMAASSGHVAIYLGGKKVAHADWRDGVTEDTLQRSLFRHLSGVYRFKDNGT